MSWIASLQWRSARWGECEGLGRIWRPIVLPWNAGIVGEEGMYIERMELQYVLLPLRSHFETSFGCAYQRDTILIRLRADGVDGVRHPSKLLLVFPRNGGNRVAYAERLPGAGISERRS